MTSFRQIEANRINARKSTGPRTTAGKQRSRCNPLRHGLTAETVIAALECAADYRALEASLLAEHCPRTATERELVLRLASILWRLRRSSQIETGLFQTEAELMQEIEHSSRRGRLAPPPQWLDQLDAKAVPTVPLSPIDASDCDQAFAEEASAQAQTLASCFLRVSQAGAGTFDLLQRYETALWRQAAQILFILQSAAKRCR